MKKERAIFLFLFLSFFFTSVQAQVDSLKKILATQTTPDTAKANTLILLCRAYLSETNDMEQLEYYNNQLMPLSKQLKFQKGIGYVYVYAGILCRIRSDYPQALIHYQHALNIFEPLKEKKGIAMCYINIGLTEDRLGNYTKAIKYGMAAAKIRKEMGDVRGTASTLSNIAISYGNLGDYKQAMNYYFKSLELRESIHDKFGMSVSYLNIGNAYELQGNLKESEKFLLKALPLKIEVGDKEGEAYVYSNLASNATVRKDYKQALIMLMKALKMHEEMNARQNINQTYNAIAANYFDQKKYGEALVYFLKSEQSSKTLGEKVNWIDGCLGAGKCYEQKGNYQEAFLKYEQALTLSKESNYIAGLRDALNNLSSVQEKLGNYRQALIYERKFTLVKDSLLNEASLKQVAELNTRYETDRKEKEILLLTKDQLLKDKTLKQQRLVRIGLIIGLGLFLALSFLLFNRYRYKQKANLVLKKQKNEITEKNIQITDSIDYAKTIQEAILPDTEKLNSYFNDYFILYRPKAIVSGDFYWIGKKDNKIICAVADCTGHGVPGAFMSLLGHNILENVVQRESSVDPGAILTTLNKDIVARFSKGKEQETVKHGMDVAIISLDMTTLQLEYAGARNSIYIAHDKNLTEIKADKMSTGIVTADHSIVNYKNNTCTLQKGDMIYLFSDGFPDQKGGSDKKKFYYAPFKELLLSISHLSMQEQQLRLDQTISNWIGEGEQVDDILVMGIRC
jgi:serine phosphatase RsbU (regulator of sigma subunit)/Flp pilus assembly protein TadD